MEEECPLQFRAGLHGFMEANADSLREEEVLLRKMEQDALEELWKVQDLLCGCLCLGLEGVDVRLRWCRLRWAEWKVEEIHG